jgi:hypothetical protein
MEQQRAFGLYTTIDTTAAKAQAREAAGLAVRSHQAQAQAATPVDLREARGALEQLLQRQAALNETGQSLPNLHGRDGQRLVRQIAEGWERFGDAGSTQLRSVLSEAQFALGRKLVRTVKDVLMDRDRGQGCER